MELQNVNWWRWRFNSCNFFVGCKQFDSPEGSLFAPNWPFFYFAILLNMHIFLVIYFRNHLWYILMLILEFAAKDCWICLGMETQLRRNALFYHCSTAYKYDYMLFGFTAFFFLSPLPFLNALFLAAILLSAYFFLAILVQIFWKLVSVCFYLRFAYEPMIRHFYSYANHDGSYNDVSAYLKCI